MDKKEFSTWELEYPTETDIKPFFTSIILTVCIAMLFTNLSFASNAEIKDDISVTKPTVVTETVSTTTTAIKPTTTVAATTTTTTTSTTAKKEISMSKADIDLIALVTMAEAEGESELGKRLVIDTILNRVDHKRFPNTVREVIYYPNAFTSMWNGRVNRCTVREDIRQLVIEELESRTNYDCVFFTMGRYSDYGVPMFREDNHYFSSYQ